MNLERPLHSSDPRPYDSVIDDGTAGKKRRRLIAAVVLIAALLFGAWYAFGRKDAAAAGEAAAKGEDESLPTVTVIVPGRENVTRVISANGALAARREMPVGVAGEGGQIVRVLVEPGQWVGAGQVLATIDRQVQTQQLGSLSAQIRVAQADAKLAQTELERAQALAGRGFVSKADIDRKTATRDAASARVRVAQATLSEAQARTGRLDIRAPAAGLVLTRNVEPGQVVSAGSGVLFRMARGGEMELLAQLSEADLAAIPVGTRATVRPVGSDESFAGQVWQVSPVIDPATRQGTARIALAYSPALRPGGFAAAELTSGHATLPLLPESAVQSDAQGNYVMVVGADGKIARRDVKVGSVSDRGLSITTGLDGTERVVLSAGAFLTPGERVKATQKPLAAAPQN